MSDAPSSTPLGSPRLVGRYALFDEIGFGGTATVHLGRLTGPVGFSKTVAIKKMHANVVRDRDVVAMFSTRRGSPGASSTPTWSPSSTC